MKKLIVYYSLDGNTKAAAERISEELGCDIAEIRPEKPLRDKGFIRILAGGKQATFNEKPAIKPLEPDPKNYDLIILGTPIWAGKAAAPVWTFVNSCAAPEKIRALFTSSGSGENEKCIKQLQKLIPDLRVTVSLVDSKFDKNGENVSKTAAFIDELKALD